MNHFCLTGTLPRVLILNLPFLLYFDRFVVTFFNTSLQENYYFLETLIALMCVVSSTNANKNCKICFMFHVSHFTQHLSPVT